MTKNGSHPQSLEKVEEGGILANLGVLSFTPVDSA